MLKKIKISTKIISVSTIILILILVISTYFSNMISNKNIDEVSSKVTGEMEMSLEENLINSSKIALSLMDESLNLLKREADLITASEDIKSILVYNVIVKNGYIFDNMKMGNDKIRLYKTIDIDKKLSNMYYQKCLSRLISELDKKIEKDISFELVDKYGNVRARIVPDGKNFNEKNNSLMIQSVYKSEISIVNIISKKDEMAIKAYSLASEHYQSKNRGILSITKKINLSFAHNLKNATGSEILIFNENGFVTGTLFKFGDKTEQLRLEKSNLSELMKKDSLFTLENLNINLGIIKGKNIKKNYKFVFTPIKNYFGENIGVLGLGLPTEDLELSKINFKHYKQKMFVNMRNNFIIILIIGIIIGIVLINILAKGFTKKITKILNVVNKISDGDFDNRIIINSEDELDELSEDINKMAKKLKDDFNKEIEHKNEIINLNRNLEDILIQRTEAVKNLLDNAGQGFFTFGEKFLIDDDYSLECIKIFDKDIAQKLITDIIIFKSEEDKNLFIEISLEIFKSEINKKTEVFLELLPKDIKIGERFINLNYKVINNSIQNKIMIIATDVTENKILEKKVIKDKNNLKMMVKIISNNILFKNLIRDYEKFYFNLKEDIQINKDKDEYIYEVFRKIHTFKGNFSQFYLLNTEKRLNKLENIIYRFIQKDQRKYSEFKNIIINSNLEEYLIEDIININKYLDYEYFSNDNEILVEENKLIDIENKIISMLSPLETSVLIPELRRLRYVSLKKLLYPFIENVNQLSEKLGKQISSFTIEGEDITVDTDKYYGFISSLVHVFRNIIDHGIEFPEERIEKKKKPGGEINCNLFLEEDYINFSIKDDGKGIDIEKIKSKLKSIDMDVNNIDEEEIYRYIFVNDISSKDKITDISGKGVGLSVVKKEVFKLHGTVDVKSEVNVGTEFIFKIPYIDLKSSDTISSKDILKIISFELEKYFEESLMMTSFKCSEIILNKGVKLYDISSIINIKGNLYSDLILSFDKKIIETIGRNIYKLKTEEELEKELFEINSETLNQVIGTSSQYLKDKFNINLTYFEINEMLKSDNLYLQNNRFKMYSCEFDSEFGKGKLILIDKKGD